MSQRRYPAADVIESTITGHQPADLNIEKPTKRTDLPIDWAQQYKISGFI